MTQERFTFFYSGPFSQWHWSPFVVDGIWYSTAEHYMMWYKDQIFGGTLEKEILAAGHPKDAKDLGRLVPNFNAKVWNAVAKVGVFRGNMAKFTQNRQLWDVMKATDGTTLVEASPWDTIWGIGRGMEDPGRLSRETWLGTNWLGEVLTEVRDSLLARG